jgi:tRNA U34 2-thiouridine synthase MnmA/TrmU
MTDNKRPHAIALFSGGLDSALAILMMLQQNIEVTALTFLTHFGCDIKDRSSCSADPYPVAEKFKFNVRLVHLGEQFIKIVQKPKYGYGRNMNPCVDCRILMLKEAKEYMRIVGADFVITGEVLGQRPKSQHRGMMRAVERDSGLEGLLLRPLCAKLLDPTVPEINGLVKRELLGNFNGRSRKPQIALAEKFGLEDYPSPAAGCLLTDISYSNRLRDLMRHSDRIDFNDLNLLRVGRHFRLDENTKIIIGRREHENDKILQYAKPEHILLEALDIGSPIGLYISTNGDGRLPEAAALTARYCDNKNDADVEISVINEGDGRKFRVRPADMEYYSQFQLK